MGKRTILGTMVVAVGTLLLGSTQSHAQTAANYLQAAQALEAQAQSYEAVAQRLTGTSRTQYLQVAQQYRQMAAYYRQLAGQASRNSPPPPSRPTPPAPAPFDAGQIARQANQAWLNRIGSMRPGRNGGFLIYFSNPPIYQGQTAFTQNARPYFARAYEVQRVIQMMTNNRQRIDNIVSY